MGQTEQTALEMAEQLEGLCDTSWPHKRVQALVAKLREEQENARCPSCEDWKQNYLEANRRASEAEAKLRAAPAVSPDVPQHGWLIERRNPATEWVTVKDGLLVFTGDPAQAIRQVKSCLPASSTTQSDEAWWKIVTANLNRVRAAASPDVLERIEGLIAKWREPHGMCQVYYDTCADELDALRDELSKERP